MSRLVTVSFYLIRSENTEGAFTNMIQQWQDVLQNNNLRPPSPSPALHVVPVLFAQLHAYCNGILYCGITSAKNIPNRELALPLIREAQLRTAIMLRNTPAMSIGADLGDTAYPLGSGDRTRHDIRR
jgi:hypothetical protein